MVATSERLSIELTPDAKQLGKVVVVGYGTQDRKSLINTVAKINPRETQQIPVASFDAQLQAAGVQVRGASSINSSNDPLYVIDGLFANSNTLITTKRGDFEMTKTRYDLNVSQGWQWADPNRLWKRCSAVFVLALSADAG